MSSKISLSTENPMDERTTFLFAWQVVLCQLNDVFAVVSFVPDTERKLMEALKSAMEEFKFFWMRVSVEVGEKTNVYAVMQTVSSIDEEEEG